METNTNENAGRDPELWRIAKKRAAFKYHLLIYFVMNIFFWTIWYISLKNNSHLPAENDSFPWPIWPMLGWGIGVVFNYFAAYRSDNQLVEKEYQKLKNKQ